MSRFLQIACLIFLLCVGMTCDGEFHYPVDVMDFTLSHMDNSGRLPVEWQDTEGISKEAYVIKIDLKFYDEFNENGLSADYECRLKDPIQHIRIFSVNTGEENTSIEVTDRFKSYQIIDPVNKCNRVPIPMESLEYLQNSIIYMALLEKTDPGTYQYEVTITLISGQMIRKLTEPVILY